jgi:hypothetical protein
LVVIRSVFRLAPVMILSALPGPLGGQSSFQVDSTGPYVLERSIRDRWIRGSQNERIVPFNQHREWIHFRRWTTRSRDPFLHMDMKLRNLEADLILEPNHQVRALRLTIPGTSIRRNESRERRAHNRRRRLTSMRATFSLPESRLWETTFVLPPEPLRDGVTWSDTLTYVADPGDGLYEEMNGVWSHRVVGDTLVGELNLPIVLSRAEVRFTSVEPNMDYAINGVFVINREVSGTITGRSVVDTILGVRALGSDTLAWEGTSTLELQDGRSLQAPVRYQGTRSWVLRDSLTWVALRDSMREERRRQDTGMLVLPTSPLQERLATGDSLLADSILGAWQSTHDPNERWELWHLLDLWGSRSGIDQEELERQRSVMLMEMGDTARVLTELLRPRPALTLEDLELLLPYLDDLERFWRVGMDPQYHHGQLATDLFNSSPLLEPDTSRWWCRPDACERLVRLVETAQESRLRDAALVGAFARDPATWYDSIRARAEAGSRSAGDALRIANGATGSRFLTSSRPLLPGSEADWRSWLEWLGGSVQFGGNHRKALLLYRATHSRDPVEELRRLWPPEADSAQAVIGAILQGMGALPRPTLEQLAAEFLSGSAARVSAAATPPGLHSRRRGLALVAGAGVAPVRRRAGDLGTVHLLPRSVRGPALPPGPGPTPGVGRDPPGQHSAHHT